MEKKTLTFNLDNIENATYNYVVAFDIYHHKYVNGFIKVDDNNLYVYDGDKQIKSYILHDYDGFLVVKTNSGGYLKARKGKKDHLIVAFTNHYFNDVANLSICLNNYLKNKKIIKLKENNTHCPICNLPYQKGTTYCQYCNEGNKILRYFVKYVKKYSWLIVLQVIITFLSVGINSLRPQLYERLIDNYIAVKILDNGFYVLFVLLSITFVLQTILLIFGGGFINPTISNGIVHDIRVDLYKKIQSLSLSNATNKTTGALITRISDDTAQISTIISQRLHEYIGDIIQIVVLLFIMFIDDWKLSLIILLPLPVMAILIRFLWSKIDGKYVINWKYLSGLNGVLYDILNGIKVVKTYGMEEKEGRRFDDANKKNRDINAKTEMFWSTYTPIIFNIFSVVVTFIYLYLGSKILDAKLGYGSIIKWVTYANLIYNAAMPLTWAPRDFGRAKISAGKIVDLLQEKAYEDNNVNKLDNIKGKVVFDHVTFAYDGFEDVITDCSFEVNEGETIGIVGYSGSGKTTLVNLLMKLYEPQSGKIFVDGIDLSTIDGISYRSKLGVVLQETLLFSGTITDNIAYSNENASIEEIMDVAKIADAHKFILEKPFGYETKLGKQGDGLSGGQKQRIAIARAILSNPSLFIFDEATSSLDTITESEIQEKLTKISKGKTTFIIAHRLSTLKNADRLIVMNKGKLVEIGTHLELMKKKGYYYSLVKAQLMNYEREDNNI